MIRKLLERNAGTIIYHRGAWVLGNIFSLWNIVENDDTTYRCKLGHVAEADNEPGTGAYWSTYWEVWGPAGNVWGNRALNIIFDGGGVVLTTGVKAMVEVPFALKITSGKIFSLDGTSGSIQIDLWKDSYANFPPTSGDNIKSFSLVSGVKSSESVSLTLAQGDSILFNIDSVTSIKLACLSLILGVA
jgi:hypothetical protein